MSANGNEESTGENCHSYISVVNAITLYSCTIKHQYNSAWGLLRVCAACPSPSLNQSYDLRPPWEQHPRYVPHRVRNGYKCSLWFMAGGRVTELADGPIGCGEVARGVCVCVCVLGT